MTDDATLQQDVRKLLNTIDAFLTYGSGGTEEPVLDMINELASIRTSLEQCAEVMQSAAAAMREQL